MIVFHSDLDNTLIYSYKHEIGKEKRCVEIYQGREISYMTRASYELLKRVRDKILFVPTTTRTREQYERIDMGGAVPEYALVCNGGVLLTDGGEDEGWYQESLRLVADCQKEFERAREYLKTDRHICFEIRNIRELFLFTKSSEPEETVGKLRARLRGELVDVFSNGQKVYVVPGKLNKGTAVERFREKIHPDFVIAAGDSEFDIPMLAAADLGMAPGALAEKYTVSDRVICADKTRVFSDTILKYIWEELECRRV